MCNVQCLLINKDSRKNCSCEKYVIYKWVNYHCQSLFGCIHQRQSLCFAPALLFRFFCLVFVRFSIWIFFFLFSFSSILFILNRSPSRRTHKLYYTYAMRKMNSISIIFVRFHNTCVQYELHSTLIRKTKAPSNFIRNCFFP